MLIFIAKIAFTIELVAFRSLFPARYPQRELIQRIRKTAQPLRLHGFYSIFSHDDSYWARTSDLYPVKVALSQLSLFGGLLV